MQKVYLLKLKNEVTAFIENFKKRYQLFPWNKVNQLKKFELRSNIPITVNGTDFSVMELVKEINKTKNKIQGKLKPSYYNFILKAYIKDSMDKTDTNLHSVYTEYKEQLNESFKESRQDLAFCLEGLKELNKAFKRDNKDFTESFMNNDERNNKYMKESTGQSQKDFFENFKNFIKRSKNPSVLSVKPLSQPMHHKTKDGEDWLLLGTIGNGPTDKTENDYKKLLKKNVKYNGEEIEYHSCYLPGDIFVFIKLPKVIKENTNIELYNDLRDFVMECYDLFNNIEPSDSGNDIFEEGGNLDARKAVVQAKPKINLSFKTIKNAIKEEDYNTAKSEISKVESLLNETTNAIKSANYNVGSAVLGSFAEVLILLGKLSVGAAATLPVMGMGGLIAGFKEMIAILTGVREHVNVDAANVQSLNVYRTKLLGQVSLLKAKLDDFKERIPSHAVKTANNNKPVNNKNNIKPIPVKESEENNMLKWYEYVSESGEYVDLRDFVLECYTEACNEEDDDIFEEGVNLDILSEFKPLKKKYYQMMKEIKKARKEKKYDKAIDKATELSELTNDIYKKIDKTDSSVGSVFFGFFTSWTVAFLRNLLLILAAPFTFNITAYIAWIKNLIEQWKKPVTKMVKSEGLSIDDFNFYKNVALDQAANMKNASKKLLDVLKEEKKEYEKEIKEQEKKDKAVEESANYRAAKYALYEACSKGEITIEEREELFKDLQDKFYVKERTSDITEKSGITNKQKFDEVRRVLYERCNAGEITIEERESLITKAHNMIFVNEGDDSNIDKAASELDEKEVTKNVDDAIKNSGKDIEASLDKALK